MNKLIVVTILLAAFSGEVTLCKPVRDLKGEQTAGPEYWVPRNPPKAYYKIDCLIDPCEGVLEGTEIIRSKNTTSEPMSQYEVMWVPGGNMEITSAGKEIKILAATNGQPQTSWAVIEFLEPISPGEIAELEIKFHVADAKYKSPEKIAVGQWCPRLWWGFETHDNYDVRISKPEEYTIATSGLLNPKTGYYHAEGVRSFGLFFGKGYETIESNAKGVQVRCIFAPNGRKCAELVLETGVQAINFYRQRFGFYPSSCLTIIPGMNRPAGGYPVATNIVAIHGMGQFESKPKTHWQWITAHEIGHQYWGEYILSKDPTDSFNWLMIGLGIYADRELVRSHGINSNKHRSGFIQTYINGVRKGLDTTINISEEQRSRIKFDYNNVVEHGKSYSVISALDCVFGNEIFGKIYQRCLDEFAGRRLGISEFRAICEEESSQDLGWFFDQWVHSNKFLSYEISSQKCEKLGSAFRSEIEVRCLGNLKMPVPVKACFEDGTFQSKFTNRLLEKNTLTFESKTQLMNVILDPDGELALVFPPPMPGEAQLAQKIKNIQWTGAGEQALIIFNEAKEVKLSDAGLWFKLGLTLYDGKYYQEAFEAFGGAQLLAEKTSNRYFVSLVWQGHLLDLLGKRKEALVCYENVLKESKDFQIRHDQYKMVVNRGWVEQRMKTPFVRNGSKEKETKHTVSNLEVLGLEFEPIHQGNDNVVRVKVKNSSDQEQTFGIHIGTKCPGYRGRFSGWGRPFFDVLKSNETKEMAFEFEIFGPITDTTWMALSFYNPASAEEHDSKKWFKKIRYTSEDIEEIGIDRREPSDALKKQTRLIKQVFSKMQEAIRGENYPEAWQLFTKDYQHNEFSDNFETFAEIMSFYKSKFLALEPDSVTAREEVFTLIARSEFMTLALEFIQVGKPWQIKWMRATAEGDWKESLLPQMEKLSTKHFDIYYFKGSTVDKEIDLIVEQKERGFSEICRFLGQDSDVLICMVFFEDGKTKQFETGHTGAGWAYGTTIVEIYNAEQKLDPYHETVHVLMGPRGNPPALFNEGFAVYMSERLGVHGLEDLGGGQSTTYERVRELESKNELIKIKELLGYTEIGSRGSRPSVAYPEAASFVKFLIDSFGKDKFLHAYKELQNSGSRQVREQNIEKLANIYGISLATLEKQWRETFMKSQRQ